MANIREWLQYDHVSQFLDDDEILERLEAGGWMGHVGGEVDEWLYGKWEDRPPNFSHDPEVPLFKTWAKMGPGYHRDSPLVARSNFEMHRDALEDLGREESWLVLRTSHFLVGWAKSFVFDVFDYAVVEAFCDTDIELSHSAYLDEGRYMELEAEEFNECLDWYTSDVRRAVARQINCPDADMLEAEDAAIEELTRECYQGDPEGLYLKHTGEGFKKKVDDWRKYQSLGHDIGLLSPDGPEKTRVYIDMIWGDKTVELVRAEFDRFDAYPTGRPIAIYDRTYSGRISYEKGLAFLEDDDARKAFLEVMEAF